MEDSRSRARSGSRGTASFGRHGTESAVTRSLRSPTSAASMKAASDIVDSFTTASFRSDRSPRPTKQHKIGRGHDKVQPSSIDEQPKPNVLDFWLWWDRLGNMGTEHFKATEEATLVSRIRMANKMSATCCAVCSSYGFVYLIVFHDLSSMLTVWIASFACICVPFFQRKYPTNRWVGPLTVPFSLTICAFFVSICVGSEMMVQLCSVWMCAVFAMLIENTALMSLMCVVSFSTYYSVHYGYLDDFQTIDWEEYPEWIGAGYERAVAATIMFLTTSCVRQMMNENDKAQKRLLNAVVATKEKQQQELQAEGDAKMAFLAMMSHELRTPLNAVIGMSELLSASLKNESQVDLATTIQSSSLALLSVINDVLDFSRVREGHMQLESKSFDPADVVEDVVMCLYSHSEDFGVEILSSIDLPADFVCYGDQYRLRQVLTNLTGNALKFTNHGHVTISVCAVEADEQTNMVTLQFTVTDSGAGVPDDKLQAIFDPFTQAESTAHRKYDGTGLGLAISRSIVEAMAGEIWVESEVGVGSEFFVRINFPVPEDTTLPLNLDDGNRRKVSLKPDAPRVVIFDGSTRHAANLQQQIAKHGVLSICVLSYESLTKAVVDGDAIGCILDAQTLHEAGVEDPLQTLEDTLGCPVVQLVSSLNVDRAEWKRTLSKPLHRKAVATMVADLKNPNGSPTATKHVIPPSPAMAHDDWRRRYIPEAFHVLLAEDNVVNRKVAAKMLNAIKVDFTATENGRQAVERFRRLRPSVVLMDCHMPVMDGLEATRRIRQYEAENDLPRTPIVALTADTFNSEAIYACGMDAISLKPLRLNTLRDVLQTQAANGFRNAADASANRKDALVRGSSKTYGLDVMRL